jgi:hypothetical protein
MFFAGRAQLQAVHSKATLDLHNIESVFAAFEMAKRFRRNLGTLDTRQVSGLSDSMRALIVRTLEMSLRFPWDGERVLAPAPYGSFAEAIKLLRQKHQVSIITFKL